MALHRGGAPLACRGRMRQILMSILVSQTWLHIRGCTGSNNRYVRVRHWLIPAVQQQQQPFFLFFFSLAGRGEDLHLNACARRLFRVLWFSWRLFCCSILSGVLFGVFNSELLCLQREEKGGGEHREEGGVSLPSVQCASHRLVES